ncbi:MAK10-like protein [Tanacetum coccineum]
MGDANPIRTLGDYSEPSHEGYRNIIELPVGNNVVPLRSDTIRLVQNECSFHGLLSEDPNQHLKDFLKLVDSLDLDDENRERMRLPRLAPTQPNQVNKITTSCEICSGPHVTQYCKEDPEQAFVEYASLRTEEARGEHEPTIKDEFQDLHLNLPVLEVLAHALIYNSILDKYVESLEPDKNGSAFIQGKVSAKMEDPRLFTLPCRLGDSKPFDTLADLGSCVNIIPLYLFKKLNIGLLEETNHIFGLADRTKSYPVGIVKDVEVHIGKLKLLNDFYVIDIKKDPKTPLLVGRGFLATANAVIDYRMAKIAVGEGIIRKDFLDCHLPGEWEIARDVEINPFKEVIVFRRMVKFLGAIPINLKSNMWESEDLINNPIKWNKPPKNEDGAWHAKIRLIDPDGEDFTKTLQSTPTTRKLSERESTREIIDLDHFYDT